MKTFFIFAFLLFPTMAFAWGNDVQVDGYSRNDGTYVQPHMRTAPDNTTNNNYSTYGNTNPYTGQQGTQSYGDTFSGNSLNRNGNNHLGGMDSGRQSSNPALRTR